MTKFQGVDYYNIETLLSEEEILVRNTVREFVDDNIIPIIEKHYRVGTYPKELVPKMAELGMFGSTLRQNTAARNEQRRLRFGDAGIRKRRQRRPQFCFRPERARHVPDLYIRFGRTKRFLAAETCDRRENRMLRSDMNRILARTPAG